MIRRDTKNKDSTYKGHRSSLKYTIFERNKCRRLTKFFTKNTSGIRETRLKHEIFNKYITTAPIYFHSHGNVIVPGCWMKPDVPCPNSFLESVLDYSFMVSVSIKLLNIKHRDQSQYSPKNIKHNQEIMW